MIFPCENLQFEHLSRGLVLAATSFVDYRNKTRTEKRIRMTIPCCVIPIDRHNKPLDKLITAITTDISTSGIGFLYSDPIEPCRILISLKKSPTEVLHLIAEIVRCGGVNGYYKIGAKLEKKINTAEYTDLTMPCDF